MSSTAVFSLLIINKAGGLIYQKNYSEGLTPLSSNEYLVLAGTFHGIHAIAGRISPIAGRNNGVESVEAEGFRLTCFQTVTGIKFVVITTPSHPSPKLILAKVYEIYAEHLKDPFYKSEMPIRGEHFDEKCRQVVAMGGMEKEKGRWNCVLGALRVDYNVVYISIPRKARPDDRIMMSLWYLHGVFFTYWHSFQYHKYIQHI